MPAGSFSNGKSAERGAAAYSSSIAASTSARPGPAGSVPRADRDTRSRSLALALESLAPL